MRTIRDYCKQLGWTITDLSREARVSYPSAYKAVNQQSLSSPVKRHIVEAIGNAVGETIHVGDIQWRNE